MLRKLALIGIVAAVGRSLLKGSATSRGTSALPAPGGPGHLTRDLSATSHPDGQTRAEDHFRPDPHAAVSPEDRESLRPATVAFSGTPAGYH